MHLTQNGLVLSKGSHVEGVPTVHGVLEL
jgi:hypothetical protein